MPAEAVDRPTKPEYLGDPTLGQIMRRPQWLLALLFALAVAAGFAWLGQWQLGSAIRTSAVEAVDTETPRALAEVSTTAQGVTEAGAAVVVRLDGAFVAGDTRVVAPRDNQGERGAWVVGHLVAEGPDAEAGAHLAVAIGWAPSTVLAEDAIAELEADPAFAEPRSIEGRYMPPEGPQIPDGDEDPQVMRTMMPAFLANSWSEVDAPVYSGYLVLHADGAPAGASALAAIDSVPALPPEQVNWLNVFYAIEWVVFAGFAVFFWFRLTRDAWEREHELQLLEAEAAAATDPDPDPAPDART
ncbi:hypothetical protein MUN77_04810 [Leucobacter allii]|uniref:SURF1 family cytochrome oxidase biogenesis protein n=1 Tax=Leucobacter allii TaxID=2932247 RepID=UPI001FD02E3D|nr:SURF1 family cytochrome oxidase biogenesis protein [Leucobacter allii]UOR02634.1 hypothetical protein MUN77_04810 [Leucobacter allii]